MISEHIDIDPSHVSRALGERRNHALIGLLVSEDQPKGRLYGSIDEGTEIWQTIEAHTLV